MAVIEKEVKRRAFDLDKMVAVSLVGKLQLDDTPPDTFEKALELAQGSKEKLLTWIHAGYLDETVKTFRRSLQAPSDNIILAPGALKKFASMFFVYDEVAKMKTRKEKYTAAFSLIKANPVLLQTAKNIAAKAAEAEAESEEEPEEPEETETNE